MSYPPQRYLGDAGAERPVTGARRIAEEHALPGVARRLVGAAADEDADDGVRVAG